MARTFHPPARTRAGAVRPRRRAVPATAPAPPPPVPLPRGLRPMLATQAQALPADPSAYSFEYKWDGVRALATWDGQRLRIESRNGHDVTHRYPELGALGEALGSRTAVLDGEIVALDHADRPSFPLLQRRMHVQDPTAIARLRHEVPAWYLLFDVLHLDGHDLTGLTYLQRRDVLEQLTLLGPQWRVPPSVIGDGEALLESAREQQLEGIVAKRNDSTYLQGQRSAAWLKVKLVAREELVIGGWVPEGGGADERRVGTLLVGYHDAQGRLRYAGGVGTGFDAGWHATLSALLRRAGRLTSPFHGRVPKAGARFVEPVLVAEVEYRRWPEGGSIQQAAFKGLRTDKPAGEVVLARRACA